MGRIVEKRILNASTRLFVVHAPLVARNAQPGQFVIIRVYAEGERVPVTMSDFDQESGTVTIVVQEVGKTTRLICGLPEGGQFLDFVGPLGRPAPLPEQGRVVLVGGGFGAAAIYPLARELKVRGAEVVAIVGARTRDLLILTEEMAALADNLYFCTDDGSAGYRGFVTGQLEELLKDSASFTHAFAIGPLPMMRAVAETTRPFGLKTWVSLDPIMVDGTGMCGACRVSIEGRNMFACIDGPFFDAHKVNFAEAVIRSKMYAEEQQLALQASVGE